MKRLLQVLVVGSAQTSFPAGWEKQSESNRTRSVSDKPNWFEDASELVRVSLCVPSTELFIAQQLQLVLVFGEQSLESQVLANHRQNLTQ